MQVVIAIAALIGLALLSASAARRSMNNRLTGMAIAGLWGAAIVGAVLGADAVGLVDDRTRELATPLVMATLGWVGMMIGLQFRREVVARVPALVWRLVAIDAAVTLAVWCPIAAVLAWRAFDGAPFDAVIGAAAALGTGMLGWSSETRTIRSGGTAGPTPGEVTIRASGAVSSLFAVIVFGLALFGVIGVRRFLLEPSALGTGLVGAGAGLVLAILGGAMLGRMSLTLAGRSRGDQLVAFLGCLTLVAGIAAKFGVSAMLSATAVGILIGNSRGFGAREFERFLLRAEIATATLLGLLVGIGATIHVSAPELILAAAVVAWRIAVKPIVMRIAAGPAHRDREMMLGAIRPHPIALAIALGLTIRIDETVASGVCTVVIMAAVVSDLVAWALARVAPRPSAPEIRGPA